MARTKKTKKPENPAVQPEISTLHIDAPYQNSRRASAVSWARKKRNKFDPSLLGTLFVSYRDKKYWVVDGMGRVFLLREVGATHVWAFIYIGLTYEEEARKFVDLNKERRPASPFQKFYGEYEARDALVVSIVRQCRKYNYDMLNASPGKNVIRCYTQIQQIAALPSGLNILDQVFEITRTCWGNFGGTTHGDIFRGLAHFIQQHGQVPGALDRLKDKLLGIHPKTVQAQAYLKRSGNSGSGGYRTIYATFIEIHNKGCSSKLPVSLRTPLVRKTPVQIPQLATSAKVPVSLLTSLGDVFKRGTHGPGFLFRRSGATRLAKRLHTVLGDRATEQFAGGPLAAKMFRAYAREERQTFSSQFAALCESWGVKYQDLLLPKKKQSTRRAKKGGNGHSSKEITGEVIFDATSSKSALEQLGTQAYAPRHPARRKK